MPKTAASQAQRHHNLPYLSATGVLVMVNGGRAGQAANQQAACVTGLLLAPSWEDKGSEYKTVRRRHKNPWEIQSRNSVGFKRIRLGRRAREILDR